MKHFWKVNIYEIQIILYWILGVLILHIGDWHWLGWVSIIWGWFTFFYVIKYAATHQKEIKEAFED